MADIIFRYPEMDNTAKLIDGYAEQYVSAANNFVTQMDAAISEWEGASQVKFQQFIAGSVNNYISTTIPEVVKGLAEVLRSNALQMKEADDQIAAAIPDSL